jgi:23S rRNA pseudouridine1911/1915/1917 synthase
MAKRASHNARRERERPPQWDDARIGAGGKVDPYAIVGAAQHAREVELTDEDDQALRRVRFELQHDLDKRLDKYLTDRISFLSRTQLQELIDAGQVTVNARPAKASQKVNAGDVIEVVVPAPPAKDIQAEDIPLDVLYEDDHLIVINKQPDIIVHPARSENTGTMLGALAYHFKHRSTQGGGLSGVGKDLARPGVVHRLDRDTSGVIVFAKSDEAHWKMGHLFEQRRVDKRYLALVHGHVEPGVFVIDLPLGPHPSREKGYREKYVVRHDELGKPSVTVVRVRERYDIAKSQGVEASGHRVGAREVPRAAMHVGDGWAMAELPKTARLKREQTNLFEADMQRFSLVELELKTGRTHQIRVHLSHNLWPIVGDDMYGGRMLGQEARKGKPARVVAIEGEPNKGTTPIITRQALHACLLGFQHPITGEQMSFQAPLRGDMLGAILLLRELSGGAELESAPGATIDLAQVVCEPSPTRGTRRK